MKEEQTQREIVDEINKLRNSIGELGLKLKVFQDKCDHPSGTYKYGANIGNWDPMDDCYWADLTCDSCFKQWSVYDKNTDYRTFPLRKSWRKIK